MMLGRCRSPRSALEDEFGDERSAFITGCPAEWAELPRPDLPLVVGLDGGYVHSCTYRTLAPRGQNGSALGVDFSASSRSPPSTCWTGLIAVRWTTPDL